MANTKETKPRHSTNCRMGLGTDDIQQALNTHLLITPHTRCMQTLWKWIKSICMNANPCILWLMSQLWSGPVGCTWPSFHFLFKLIMTRLVLLLKADYTIWCIDTWTAEGSLQSMCLDGISHWPKERLANLWIRSSRRLHWLTLRRSLANTPQT